MSDNVTIYASDGVPTAHVLDVMTNYLTSQEILLGQRYHKVADRDRFLWRRAFLRLASADYSGIPAQSQIYKRICPRCGEGAHGRPVLISDKTISLSTSQSATITLVAFSSQVVGVDVEDRYCGLFEIQQAFRQSASPEHQQIEDEVSLASIWTRKEAYVKAIGLGLALDLNRVRLSAELTDQRRLTHIDGGQGSLMTSTWWMSRFGNVIGLAAPALSGITLHWMSSDRSGISHSGYSETILPR